MQEGYRISGKKGSTIAAVRVLRSQDASLILGLTLLQGCAGCQKGNG